MSSLRIQYILLSCRIVFAVKRGLAIAPRRISGVEDRGHVRGSYMWIFGIVRVIYSHGDRVDRSVYAITYQ